MVGRVLGLGIDADPPAGAPRVALGEVDDLLEGGDPEAAVELLGTLGERLNGPQGAQLRKGEVGGEPALLGDAVDHLGGPAVGELRVLADVGGGGDVRLVPRDQVAVLGGHEVRFDVVGAELDRQRIGRKGVVGQIAGSAAVADDQRVWLVAAGRRCGRCKARNSGDERKDQGGPSAAHEGSFGRGRG